MRLLDSFLEVLFPPRDTEALIRGAMIESIGHLVRPQLVSPQVTALLPYRNPQVRALILEAKYRDNQKAQQVLGQMLAEYLEGCAADKTIILVPMPLGIRRRKERGYNQCERILAAGLGGMEIDSTVLVRTRETKRQTELGRAERLLNPKGAFKAGAINPSYTYIVVDDVVTTGATLTAAMEALKDAGAQDVRAVALAH